MSGDEAMAWWYGRIDYERRAPLPADLKLDQMRALLRGLGEPQRRVRIVHIAGSKGKGSTAAMLTEVLRAAGYRTGLFTSPHLCHVEERIRVDGEPISRDELVALLAEIRDSIGPGINPTYFEVATAAGWLHFVRRRVDIAVVEVGLGGRFDSTNVCSPLLTVITSISYDHTKVLGDTLARIAFEKAGILKPGVPAVSGATVPEAAAVIERIAAERGCRLVRLGHEVTFDYTPGRVDDGPPRVTVRTPRGERRDLELGLLGAHQAANAAVAIACVEELQKIGLSIGDRHVAAGLARVKWPARLEVLGRGPWVVLDCAHNTASVQALVDTLNESFPPGRRLLILAVSSDKDVPGMLKLLAPHFDRFLLTRYGQNQRAVPPEQLAEWLKQVRDVPAEINETASAAWESARAHSKPEDLIVVTGSVFLAGELRPMMTS
jgi:dihydrofolate synthase/folylpolyglutamate synthase